MNSYRLTGGNLRVEISYWVERYLLILRRLKITAPTPVTPPTQAGGNIHFEDSGGKAPGYAINALATIADIAIRYNPIHPSVV